MVGGAARCGAGSDVRMSRGDNKILLFLMLHIPMARRLQQELTRT